MRSKKSTRSTVGIGAWAIGLLVVGVVAAAMRIAARQQSPPTKPAAVEAQLQEAAMAEPTPKKVPAAQAQAKKTAAAKPPVAGAVLARTPAADAITANALGAESAAKALVQELGVTITGCLDRNDDTFRLKDTTGADAPRLRSWKSGFLKKDAASIEVVDATNRLKLPNHVGQRISVTGLLVDRQIKVRSLQRVAPSCDRSPKAHKDGSTTASQS
jgi:hypothetical protein